MIKRAEYDTANIKLLDPMRMYVYTWGGMCVDLEDVDNVEEVEEEEEDEAKKKKEKAKAKEKEHKELHEGMQGVIEERFEDAYEGKFAQFAAMYHRHQGKQGGW